MKNNERNICVNWREDGEKVILTFFSGDQLTVSKKRFNQSFGVLVNSTYEEIKRDLRHFQ